MWGEPDRESVIKEPKKTVLVFPNEDGSGGGEMGVFL